MTEIVLAILGIVMCVLHVDTITEMSEIRKKLEEIKGGDDLWHHF